MKTNVAFLSLVLALCVGAADAQSPSQIPTERKSEIAHEGRLRADAKGTELHREHLHQQLLTAEKTGDKASIARIRAELGQTYTSEKAEKAMAANDELEHRKDGIRPPSR